MKSPNIVAITLLLVSLAVQVVSPLTQVILAQSGVYSRGVLLEVAPGVFLYIDPEPIAYYRDSCGYNLC